MDAFRFAITKIQPPRPRGSRVERPRLRSAMLRATLERRVVLLQAPAGFGKTSAMAALIDALAEGTALAWVSLDEDDDANRLFACLAAALEPHDLPWRTSPDALASQMGDGGAGLRRAVAELLNALAGAGAPRGVIVLDDWHRVAEASAQSLLEGLIERLPQQWCVVLCSRVAPALPLARWRVAGELAEFGQEDLRFTADEARALAAAEDDGHAVERMAEFFERTQGWPAGLRLCLAALRTRGGLGGPGLAGTPPAAGRSAAVAGEGGEGGSGGATLPAWRHAPADRYLFDYLASEVLDDMPPALHDFLLRTAVLPTLTATRAAAVSGDLRAAERLEEIERRGLFVTSLDAAERTLVLHDLFRDALQERLRRRFLEELPSLWRRAAAGEPDPLKRVGYLLQAGHWPAAEEVLSQASQALFLQGAAGEVQRVVGQFPPEWLGASARLLRLSGIAHCLRWQWGEMAQRMAAAESAAQRAQDAGELHLAVAYLSLACYPLGRNDESEACLERLRGEPLGPHARGVVLLGECTQHFRRGEHDAVPALYAELVSGLERHGTLYDWWECAPAASWATLRGIRPVLQRYFAGALALLGDRALPMRAEVQVHQALASLWGGEIERAMAQLAVAESDMKWLACSADTEVTARIVHMICDAVHGRAQRLAQTLDGLFAREDANPDLQRRRLWQHQIGVYGLRFSDTLGESAETLLRWADHLSEKPLDPACRADTPRANVVRARYAAAQGRWDEAAALFGSALPHAGRMDTMGQAIELHLRAVHALLHCGRREAAAAAVQPALERLLAEGERGHALMCGDKVLARLAGEAWGALLAQPLQAALQELAAWAAGLREAGAAARAALPGAPGSADGRRSPAAANGAAQSAAESVLSAREREVLHLMAAGDSNKLIARTLDISPHTVKRHVANILDKLDLPSRAAAGAWLQRHA